MSGSARAPLAERVEIAMNRTWSGRGPLSTLLLPIAWVFEVGSAVRKHFYARGVRDVARLPVPVIVVGNLIVGGAGKTPTVIALVEMLRRRGYTPGIVSRGYGRFGEEVVAVSDDASSDRVGDEPLMLRRRTGAPVVVGADRVAAGYALLALDPDVDVVVSDDGLQHLGLERDVEVLVFDERGAGNGRLLPAGPMRERLPAATSPRQIVLYNAPSPTTPLPGFTALRSLAGVVPLADWWSDIESAPGSLAELRDKDVVAVAGLAQPERFFAMLRDQGLHLRELPLTDHADFATLPWPADASDVIVTEKDAVKLPPSRRMGTRVWVARLDFTPEPAFDAAVLALLPPPSTSLASQPPLGAPAHGNSPP
jgi:tetraacyldisaccharide 4'-kinase